MKKPEAMFYGFLSLFNAFLSFAMAQIYGAKSLSETKSDNDVCWAIMFMIATVTLSYNAYAYFKASRSRSSHTIELLQGILWLVLALSCIPIMFTGTQTGKETWEALIFMGIFMAIGVFQLGRE